MVRGSLFSVALSIPTPFCGVRIFSGPLLFDARTFLPSPFCPPYLSTKTYKMVRGASPTHLLIILNYKIPENKLQRKKYAKNSLYKRIKDGNL